jgi:hypothetical protein
MSVGSVDFGFLEWTGASLTTIPMFVERHGTRVTRAVPLHEGRERIR